MGRLTAAPRAPTTRRLRSDGRSREWQVRPRIGCVSNRHRVVIVGGGFAGLYAARELGKADDVALTVVDRRNFHLFQPLLYQVATGALSPGEIAQPLRSILRKNRNTTVLLGEKGGGPTARPP